MALQLTDEQEEWLRHIINDAHKAVWIEKFRKLLNQKKRIDLGTIFVANYGQLEGVYCCKAEGKPTVPAKTLGQRWEDYKVSHPDWHKQGRE